MSAQIPKEGGVKPISQLNIQEIYDFLPLTERTLLRHYKSYPFRIANDRGHPCHWYIYDGDQPVAVVIYYRGRKLVMLDIKKKEGKDNEPDVLL